MFKSYEDELQLLADKVEGVDDRSWEELVEELGIDYHPDTLRKSWNVGRYSGYNVYKYFEHKLEDEFYAQEEIDRLERLKDEVYKEKCKYSDKKREFNKALREEARFENLLDVLKESIDDLPKLNVGCCVENKNSGVEASLLLSDIHFGATVDSPVNYYNTDIAKIRLEELCRKTISECAVNRIEKINICLLGDCIAGLIHLQSQVEAEEDVISQIINVSELLSDFIVELSRHVPNIKVYGVHGNHSRITRGKEDSLIVENFERLIFNYIKLRTGISVITNGLEDYLEFHMKGKTVFCSHGNRDKMKNVRNHAINMTHNIPDFIYLGHTHHFEVNDENGTEIIVNGSIMGTDSYASSIRCNTKPYQILHIYDGKDEKIIKLNLD